MTLSDSEPVPFNRFREILPDRAGLYVVHTADPFPLKGTILEGIQGLLYAGKAQDSLLDRVVGTHFQDGTTSHSTLRRTLGAVLLDALGLHPQPRKNAGGQARTWLTTDSMVLAKLAYRRGCGKTSS